GFNVRWSGDGGRPREAAESPAQPPFPPVGVRERDGLVGALRGERAQGAQALAFWRRRVDVPGRLRQPAARRPPLDVGGVKQGASLVPERARLARRAFV